MHVKYMKIALDEARKAALKDEVPIGAVVVEKESGKIIAKAHNLSEQGDCINHAEILAIKKACKKLGTNRLRGCDLYVTLEPCTMCAGAISFARIDTLYIGALDTKGGGVVNGVKFFEQPTCHHRPKVETGILEKECSQILKDFFKAKRG